MTSRIFFDRRRRTGKRRRLNRGLLIDLSFAVVPIMGFCDDATVIEPSI
jgi:hypothetical protein